MNRRYSLVILIGCTIFSIGLVYGYRQTDSSPGVATEVELITLRPAGFEPAEIIRRKDPFVLFIDDRSGKETSLVVQRVQGERLRAINLNRKKSEWSDVLDLSPGTYDLHDARNPEFRCQIIILP